jgi:lysozyme family protein
MMTHYSQRFLRAVERVLEHEGGYVNHPADRGGETNFGISKRSYPHVDIRNLTRQGAIAIYHRDFWARSRAEEMPAGVGELVFDVAVNSGAGRAVRMLQEALIGAGARIQADGLIGPRTLEAANALDPAHTVALFRLQRIRFFTDIVSRNPTQGVFLLGWIRRALA